MLVACAAVLEDPDILVLDEPTNHLDLANIATLERWLTEVIKLPMLIVSHDRAFLNRVTTRTLFLRADGAHSFKTPFSVARQALLARDAADARRRSLEEKEIKRLEETCARYKVWAQKNDEFDKKRKIVERRIERMEAGKTKVYVARERRLELGESEMEAKVALRVEGLTVRTPDERALFNIERLAVRAGDRIALLGTNGAGKSTLLSALAREFAAKDAHYDGKAQVRFNPGARLAVFDQAMADLPLDASLIEYMTEVDGVGEREAIQALIKAGFPYRRMEQAISLLSFGERARLNSSLKAERPNFYLLDEPTNHLTSRARKTWRAELAEADVSCVFVSHDRYFTRTAADAVPGNPARQAGRGRGPRRVLRGAGLNRRGLPRARPRGRLTPQPGRRGLGQVQVGAAIGASFRFIGEAEQGLGHHADPGVVHRRAAPRRALRPTWALVPRTDRLRLRDDRRDGSPLPPAARGDHPGDDQFAAHPRAAAGAGSNGVLGANLMVGRVSPAWLVAFIIWAITWASRSAAVRATFRRWRAAARRTSWWRCGT